MLYHRILLLAVVSILCFSPAILVFAEDACPAIVNTAIDAGATACENIGRNQVCYGHTNMDITAQDSVPVFTFHKVGDITDITNVRTMRLSALDITNQFWGIALMRLQANLPDTLPGQNVTVVLFGSVQFEFANIPLMEAVTTANVNLRLRPRTNENNVIRTLDSGEQVSANGRLEDSSWIRVILQDQTSGWVSANYLRAEKDWSVLSVVAPGDAGGGVAQAFYLRDALNDSQCSEAPDSGILVQIPRGVGTVTLEINGVQVSLGSTAYVQSDGSKLRIALLAGQGDLVANQAETFVPTGTFSEVALDSSGQAPISSPGTAQSYSPDTLGALPLKLLPESVPSPGVARPYLINFCTGLQDGGPSIRAGQTIRFAVGCCGAPTIEEQQLRERQTGSPSMRLDGNALNLYITGIFFAQEGWYTNDGRYDWVAVPGTHHITGGWGSNQDTCSFEVEES
jgi:uncharacterized protein YraI